MVGLLVGAFVFSSISDRFGRKVSFFLSFGFEVSIHYSSSRVQSFPVRGHNLFMV